MLQALSQADDEERRLDAARMKQIEERSNAVDAALVESKFDRALLVALDNPPIGTKSAEVKVP